MAYLAMIPGLYFRNNRGAVTVRNALGVTRHVRFGGLPGAADILGVLRPSGKFVAIEVKRPGMEPTDEQRRFLDAVNACGGIAFTAWSVDDVARMLGAAERR